MPGGETFRNSKYEVLERIHEGGMGRLLKVRHRLMDRVRAIKELKPELARNPAFRQRFEREAQMAAKVQHPNVVMTIDYELDKSGYGYIIMEYLKGVTVKDLMAHDSDPLGLDLALEIARQGLLGLQAVHSAELVHRDVAPDNFMLVEDGGRLRVKLIDLGIAKGQQSDAMTNAGTFLGKYLYASPEHFEQAVTPLSDQYSFGVMLYELLTRQLPVVGDNFAKLLNAHQNNEPISFSVSDPMGRVPENVRNVVLRMLAKKPADRFASTAEVIDALGKTRIEHPFGGLDVQALISEVEGQRSEPLDTSPGLSTQRRIDAHISLRTTPTRRGTSRRSEQTEPDGRSAETPTGIDTSAASRLDRQGPAETVILRSGKPSQGAAGSSDKTSEAPANASGQQPPSSSLLEIWRPRFGHWQMWLRQRAQTIGTDLGDGWQKARALASFFSPKMATLLRWPYRHWVAMTPPMKWTTALVSCGSFALLVFLLLTLLLSHAPIAPSSPVPPGPAPPTVEKIHPEIWTASQCIALEEYAEAAATLMRIEEQGIALSSAEREIFDDVERRVLDHLEGLGHESRGAVQVGQSRRLKQALRDALRRGGVKSVMQALAAIESFSNAHQDLLSDVETERHRASRIRSIHTAMLRASKREQWLTALERSQELIAAFPSDREVGAQRERAASALEGECADLVARGRFNDALKLARSIQSRWSDRAGLETRIRGIKERMDQVSILGEIEDLANSGRPWQARERLRQVRAFYELRDHRRDLEDQIARRIQQTDGKRPEVSVLQMSYRRRATAVIELSIRDDHAVVSASAWVRRASPARFAYYEIALKKGAGSEYALLIPLEFHQNAKILEFYVKAVDRSENVGRLGWPDKPEELRRGS